MKKKKPEVCEMKGCGKPATKSIRVGKHKPHPLCNECYDFMVDWLEAKNQTRQETLKD